MANCTECREARAETTVTLPVILYDRDKERQQQDKKRLWILIIILIAALIISNLAWAIYENSFETVSESYQADAVQDGVAVISRQGSVNVGDGTIYESNTEAPEFEEWG